MVIIMNDVVNILDLPVEATMSGLNDEEIAKFVQKLQLLGQDAWCKEPLVWEYVKQYGTDSVLKGIIRTTNKIPHDVLVGSDIEELSSAVKTFQDMGLSSANNAAWHDYDLLVFSNDSKKDFIDKWSGISKNAIIRGDEITRCPFGLPIPNACKNAGDSVSRMAPTENHKGDEKLSKANRIIYAYYKTCKECPYADKILEAHDKVDCDFGDTAQGQKSTSFTGSPIYPQTFTGVGLNGMHGFPLGFYADNNESRNLFFGLFSLLGFANTSEMVKLANKYDECGETDKADIIDNLLNKLNNIKEEYKDTFDKVEKYLSDYRSEYENKRGDTGLLWELSQKWHGQR